jgi:hypothetical protein
MSVVRYINGSLAGQITKDFTRYARFAPPELFEPPDEPTDPYRRVVRDRIKASLPVKPSEESAADKWERELNERRWAEAKARAAAKRHAAPIMPHHSPEDIDQRVQLHPRRDEVAKTISELQSQLEATDKAIAAERRAQRDDRQTYRGNFAVESLAATPSSPGAMAQAYVRARTGCRSRRAAARGSRAQPARAGTRVTEGHPARRSPSGGSTVSASSPSRSSPMERRDRRYACATCSKNS